MIGVAGAGAFGTALAVSLSANETVTLWARDALAVAVMRDTRRAPRLADVDLPGAVTPTAETGALLASDILILALPAQAAQGFVDAHAAQLKGKTVVTACKGIDLTTLTGAASHIAQTLPDVRPAVLTGPSFAADIARGLPTALTLATPDEDAGRTLQHRLTTPNLRLYRSTDLIGAELGGALKNVIAIACGACIGRGYGVSARAALMTRGFAEMQRLAVALGAEPQTLMGLSGFGDLTLTCTSDLSRNYRFGLAWGHGEAFDAAVTVEGVKTAQAVARLAAQKKIDMPITTLVADVTLGRLDIADALDTLLARPLKEE